MKKMIKVCDAQGKYVNVTLDEVFRAAAEAIEHRFSKTQSFTSPEVVCEFLRAKLVGREREVFAVMFLDSRHRLLSYEELFYGTIDAAEVHPREIIKRALELNAAAMIISHNHPSGDPEPSAADRALTNTIKTAANMMDIRLLDHVVIGGDRAVAFSSRGWV